MKTQLKAYVTENKVPGNHQISFNIKVEEITYSLYMMLDAETCELTSISGNPIYVKGLGNLTKMRNHHIVTSTLSPAEIVAYASEEGYVNEKSKKETVFLNADDDLINTFTM